LHPYTHLKELKPSDALFSGNLFNAIIKIK
jgi:hypothetical protein